MSAYVHVFDHLYFAVTDGASRFVIEDVPPGKHTLEYWHEPVGDQATPLTVTGTILVHDGKATTSDVVLSRAGEWADSGSNNSIQ